MEVSEDEGVELVKIKQGKGEQDLEESGEQPPPKASFWAQMKTAQQGEEGKTPTQYWKEQLEPNYRKSRANPYKNEIYNIAMEECLETERQGLAAAPQC